MFQLVDERRMMSDTLNVFISGCASVFLGMGILYLTIRGIAFVVGRLPIVENDNES